MAFWAVLAPPLVMGRYLLSAAAAAAGRGGSMAPPPPPPYPPFTPLSFSSSSLSSSSLSFSSPSISSPSLSSSLPASVSRLLNSPLLALALAFSLVLLVLVVRLYPAKGRLTGRFLGLCVVLVFIGAIYLVDVLASELVNTALALGILFGISPSLLSVTLLAWGNSISDLVSNMSLARDGYPTMAVTACFASPLFVLLMGTVLSMVPPTLVGPLPLPESRSLKVLYAESLVILTVWVVGVPLVCKYRLGRHVAYSALAMYVAAQGAYVYSALVEGG